MKNNKLKKNVSNDTTGLKEAHRLRKKRAEEMRAAAAQAADESTGGSSSSGDGASDPDAFAVLAPPKNRRPDAVMAVLGAAFEDATTPEVRRRLRHRQAMAVVVVVPTVSWVPPAKTYALAAFGERWSVYLRDATDRKQDSSVGSHDVARELSRGHCVMGIAADEKLLPAALTVAADIVIRIGPPGGRVLRTAIAKFAGRNPGDVRDGIAAGLDLHEIVATFRPGTGARTIVGRLAAAGAARRTTDLERVPDLETAVEYGEARTWGLACARHRGLSRRQNCLA
jgi:hypothetical protein